MMWGYGSGMGMWGFALMSISTILFWALIIFGVVALIRFYARPDRPTGERAPGEPTPEQVLAQRFAAGEVDEQEYRQRIDVLSERHRPLTKP